MTRDTAVSGRRISCINSVGLRGTVELGRNESGGKISYKA